MNRLSHRRPSQRGFSLIELIVVVIIIAVLAVLAIPAITNQMRDRRTQEVAQRVAGFYRDARMRAMGRGAAVMVRYDGTSGPEGTIEVREAVRGQGADANCQLLPVSSCSLSTWDVAGTDNKLLEKLDTANRSELSGIRVEVFGVAPANNGKQNTMDVCFSPMGRAFVRYDPLGQWQPMTGAAEAAVFRMGTDAAQAGLTRKVLILPNGYSRLGAAEAPP